MKVNKCEYQYMLPSELVGAVALLPVFILPVGLLEWHGDHLPLGLDGLKAEKLCIGIAKKLGGGIVMPINYFSRPGFSSYTGTLTFSDGCLSILYNEIFNQLKKVGAKLIVLFTGHYGSCQVDFIKRIADIYNKENDSPKILAMAEYEDVYVEGVMPCDHAGLYETSLMQYYYEHLVNESGLINPPMPMKIYKNPPNDYYKESSEWEFFNNVNAHNKELGEKCANAIIDSAVNKIVNAYKQVENAK